MPRFSQGTPSAADIPPHRKASCLSSRRKIPSDSVARLSRLFGTRSHPKFERSGRKKRGRVSLRRTPAHRIGLPEATYAKDNSRDRHGNLSPFALTAASGNPRPRMRPRVTNSRSPSANDVPEKGTVENLGRQRKNPVPFLTKETGNPVSETDAPISKHSEQRAAKPRPHVRSGP